MYVMKSCTTHIYLQCVALPGALPTTYIYMRLANVHATVFSGFPGGIHDQASMASVAKFLQASCTSINPIVDSVSSVLVSASVPVHGMAYGVCATTEASALLVVVLSSGPLACPLLVQLYCV